MKEVSLSNGDTVFIRQTVSYPNYNRYMAIMAKMVRVQGFKTLEDYDNAEIKTDVPFTAKLEYIPMMIKKIELKDKTSLTEKKEILEYFEEIELLDGVKLAGVIDPMFTQAARDINSASKKK